MLGRPLLMTGALGAAVAAPIAMTEGPKHLEGFSFSGGSQPAAATAPPLSRMQPPAIPSPDGPGALIYESPAPIEGVGFLSLAEVFRMDVTKEWVYTRWARKSTGLAEPDLFGVRVPVVTGTAMTDLAGSISYYFNADGRVDKLRFHGRTADTTAIVAIAQQYYGMRPQRTVAGEQLLQNVTGEGVLCELRSHPEAVLWSTSPHSSFVVDLELNRPGTGQFVKPRQLTPEIPPPPQPVAEAPPAKPAAGGAAEATAAAPADAVEPAFLQNAKRPEYRWPN